MRAKPSIAARGNSTRRATTRPRTTRSLDGMRTGNAPKAAPAHLHRAPTTAATPVEKPTQKKPRTAHKFQMPLLVLLIVLGGFLIQQSAVIGETCIAVYTIIALKQHIASRLTFLLALFACVGVVVLLVFRANQTLATNFALYAFLLLAVGTITLAREVRSMRA